MKEKVVKRRLENGRGILLITFVRNNLELRKEKKNILMVR